jgi:DNA-binding HxlR family transcriptional regulator
LATALDAIGRKWSLRILYELARGPCHFNELQRLNSGISHKVLTETLRHLEGDGLIARSTIHGSVPRVQYALTSDGETVRPVLDAMIAWGHSHVTSRGVAPKDATQGMLRTR